MLNVYTFHGSVVSSQDRRLRQEVKHNQEATSLGKAWDLAEQHFAKEYPNEQVCLSVGNRQPLQLRPGYRLAS